MYVYLISLLELQKEKYGLTDKWDMTCIYKTQI